MRMLACGGGRGWADLAVLYSFCGGLRFIISMAEGRSFGGAAEGAKGAAKVLHFQRKCCISVFGLLTREKKAIKGEKCYGKNAPMEMQHSKKIRPKNGGDGGAAGADSGPNIGAEMRLFAVGGPPKVYSFCLCFVQVSRVEREGNGQARLNAKVYETRPIMACITDLHHRFASQIWDASE